MYQKEAQQAQTEQFVDRAAGELVSKLNQDQTQHQAVEREFLLQSRHQPGCPE